MKYNKSNGDLYEEFEGSAEEICQVLNAQAENERRKPIVIPASELKCNFDFSNVLRKDD